MAFTLSASAATATKMQKVRPQSTRRGTPTAAHRWPVPQDPAAGFGVWWRRGVHGTCAEAAGAAYDRRMGDRGAYGGSSDRSLRPRELRSVPMGRSGRNWADGIADAGRGGGLRVLWPPRVSADANRRSSAGRVVNWIRLVTAEVVPALGRWSLLARCGLQPPHARLEADWTSSSGCACIERRAEALCPP